jgi:hypothetical protein
MIILVKSIKEVLVCREEMEQVRQDRDRERDAEWEVAAGAATAPAEGRERAGEEEALSGREAIACVRTAGKKYLINWELHVTRSTVLHAARRWCEMDRYLQNGIESTR